MYINYIRRQRNSRPFFMKHNMLLPGFLLRWDTVLTPTPLVRTRLDMVLYRMLSPAPRAGTGWRLFGIGSSSSEIYWFLRPSPLQGPVRNFRALTLELCLRPVGLKDHRKEVSCSIACGCTCRSIKYPPPSTVLARRCAIHHLKKILSVEDTTKVKWITQKNVVPCIAMKIT